MKLGDTFVPVGGANDHLHVVVSDPDLDPARVLLVPVTTFVAGLKEDVCLFNANEHEWIRHTSCIGYGHAKTASLDVLHNLRDKGLLAVMRPFDRLLLKRIWSGAAKSVKLHMDFANILAEQGFIDC
jgi:hypothetical protein